MSLRRHKYWIAVTWQVVKLNKIPVMSAEAYIGQFCFVLPESVTRTAIGGGSGISSYRNAYSRNDLGGQMIITQPRDRTNYVIADRIF